MEDQDLLQSFVSEPDDTEVLKSFVVGSTADEARQMLHDDAEGKITLDPKHRELLFQAANADSTPAGSLWSGIKGIGSAIAHPSGIMDAVKGIGGKAASALGRLAVSSFNEDEPDTQLAGDAAAGAIRGGAMLAKLPIDAAVGVTNLVDPDPQRRAERQAIPQTFQNAVSTAARAVGDPESDVGQTAEFAAGMVGPPLGVESTLAKPIAKLAEGAVDTGAKVAGNVLEKGAKLTKAAAPAAVAATELAKGHPIWALGTLAAGYGAEGMPVISRIKHAIIDRTFDKIGDVGKVLAESGEEGQTIAQTLQGSIDEQIDKLRQIEMDKRAKFAGKISDVDKLAADGTPLYDSTRLSGPDKEVRQIQEEIDALANRKEVIARYGALNRIMSDATKFGIRMGGNTAVAGATMGAISGMGALPGEEEEAARSGTSLGMAIGLPAAHHMSAAGKLGMNTDALVGKSTIDPASISHLPKEAQEYLNKYSGLMAGTGQKVVVLSPEEYVAKLGSAGENVSQAPNGHYDRTTGTAYVNSEALNSGVVPHEVTHAIDEAMGSSMGAYRAKLEDLLNSKNPEIKSQIESAVKEYERRMQLTTPEFKMSPENLREEATAALGADLFQKYTPEQLYGGKSGGQIIKEWAKGLFGKSEEGGTTEQFAFPKTPETASELRDVMFQAGERAKNPVESSGPESALSTPPAKKSLANASIEPSRDPIFTDAENALKKLGVKDPREKVNAAYNELLTENGDAVPTLEDVVKRATQKTVPQAMMPKSEPAPTTEELRAMTSKASLQRGRQWFFKDLGKNKVTVTDFTPQNEHGFTGTPQEAKRWLEDAIAGKKKMGSFMPSDDPRGIRWPAVKFIGHGGKEYIHSAPRHAEAELLLHEELGFTPHFDQVIDGFVTNRGEFLDREEALVRAKETRQYVPNRGGGTDRALIAEQTRGMADRPEKYMPSDWEPDFTESPESDYTWQAYQRAVGFAQSNKLIQDKLRGLPEPERADRESIIADFISERSEEDMVGTRGLYGRKGPSDSVISEQTGLTPSEFDVLVDAFHREHNMDEVRDRTQNGKYREGDEPSFMPIGDAEAARIDLLESESRDAGYEVRVSSYGNVTHYKDGKAVARESLPREIQAMSNEQERAAERENSARSKRASEGHWDRRRRDDYGYMPAGHPEAITGPAIKVDDMIFKGKSWAEAKRAAEAFGINPSKPVIEGHVTKQGKFLDKTDARSHAEEIGQIPPDPERDNLTPRELRTQRQFMPIERMGTNDIERIAKENGLTPNGETDGVYHFTTKDGREINVPRFSSEERFRSQIGGGRPFMPASVPDDTVVTDSLSSDKKEYVGAHRDLPAGTPVGLRIDIPAYERTGNYVVTVHEKASGGRVGKRIGYDGIAAVDNPTFFSNERGAEKIRDGSAKFPVATVEGEYSPVRELPKDIDSWTKVGYNPKRHSYFYDKETMEPVTGGDRAISAGNTVYVQNPKYGSREDFSFMPAFTHYTFTKGLKELDPEMHGKGAGLIGAERIRRRDYPEIYQPRSYVGLDGYIKEHGLGPVEYEGIVDNLYDFKSDPEGFKDKAWAQIKKDGDYAPFDQKAATTLAEKLVKDAGYEGFRVDDVAALFSKTPVKEKSLANAKEPEMAYMPAEKLAKATIADKQDAIDMDSVDLAKRYFELDDKRLTQKLTPAEEKEFEDLHKQAVDKYGSYNKFYEANMDLQPDNAKAGMPFMPSDHPDAIKEAAIKLRDGTIKTAGGAATHGDISSEVYGDGNEHLLEGSVNGFVTNAGEFLDRNQAFDRATKLKQLKEEAYDDYLKEVGGAYVRDKMKGRLDSVAFEDTRTDPHFMPREEVSREAERLGLEYKGDMGDKKKIHLFNDPITKSTISVKEDAPSGALQEKLRATRDKFLNPDGLKFMPSENKDAIKEAAIKLPDGSIFTGMTHPEAWMKAEEAGKVSRGTKGISAGWIDGNENFLDRQAALARAKEVKQVTQSDIDKANARYGGKQDNYGLESLDFQKARKFMPAEPTVNIGLDVNDGSKLSPEEAVAALKKVGVNVVRQSIGNSATEPTLIATLSRPLTAEEAYKVSSDLKQDAIAQFDGKKGELYGPAADKWKPFNEDYFLSHDRNQFMPAEGDEHRISQRVPTAKGATEDALTGNLMADASAILSQPKFADKLAAKLKTYEGFKTKATDTKGIIEDFINQAKDNLVWLHDQMPPEVRERAKKWYDGANKIAGDLSEQYGHSKKATAAVMAALSPQNPWHNNVSLAERVLDIATNKTQEPWSKEMQKVSDQIFAGPKYKDIRRDLKGKSFSDLDNNYLKAAWLRIYDEAHNPREYHVVTPEGGRGDIMMTGDNPTPSNWFSLGPIEKALNVLDDPSRENISQQMGYAHKVRNFYNNIIAPNSEHGDYTNDTHAVAAALIKPLGGTSEEVLDNFGAAGKNAITGIKGTYPLYAEAGRRAAAERGILPREMQSITWEAIRGMFSPEFKLHNEKGIAKINEIWKDYQDDKITIDEARNQISQVAGGIEKPEWFGENQDAESGTDGIPEEQGAVQPGDISGVSVPESGPDPAPRRGRNLAAARTPEVDAPFMPANNGFYSKLEEVAKEKLPNKASAGQILATLKSNGVKAEEMKWTGLDDFLKDNPNPTKKELLEHVRANNVQVKEVVKGEVKHRVTVDGSVEAEFDSAAKAEDYARELSEEQREHNDTFGGEDREINVELDDEATKFGEHQLSGADEGSYRELLLTLPPKEGAPVFVKKEHFSEPNVIAHVRFNSRTIDGKRSLFLEEIQSDAFQKQRQNDIHNSKLIEANWDSILNAMQKDGILEVIC